MPDVKEMLAKREALKAQAQEIINSAPNGLSAEQNDKFSAIKTDLQSVNNWLDANHVMQDFNAFKPSYNVPGSVNPTENVFASKDYEQAFRAYAVSGGRDVPSLLRSNQFHATNLSEGTGSAGGFVLPTTVEQQITQITAGDVAMRQLATVVPTTQDIAYPVESSIGAAGQVGETSTYTVNDPAIALKTLGAFKVAKSIDVTEELFNDYGQLIPWLTSNLGRAFAVKEDALFVTGAGSTTAPEGVATAALAGFTQTAVGAAAINFTNDLNMLVASLPSAYLNGASFLMNRSVKGYLRTLVNGNGIPFWPYDDPMLLGYPVALSDNMPALANDTKVILFGNFKRGVIIGDRQPGTVIKIDPYTGTKSGLITIAGNRRVDQRVLLPEAVRYLETGSAS